MERCDEGLSIMALGGETMRAPEEVAVMLRRQALGWGAKRIAAELGCSRSSYAVGLSFQRQGTTLEAKTSTP